jgi:hypothetical protein
MNDVPKRQPWASEAKPLLTSWGIDPHLNKVRVGITEITPRLTDLAKATFGDMVVLVQETQPRLASKKTRLPKHFSIRTVDPRRTPSARLDTLAAPAPTPSRLLDSMPYWGGDRIYRLFTDSSGDTYVLQCTVAFMWSTPAMSSAGHCGPNGTVWTQGYFDEPSQTLYRTGTMGTVFSVQWGNGRIDAELMNRSTWDAKVYTALQSEAEVSGYTLPLVGDRVCFDGSVTGEICSPIIRQTNICVNVLDPDTGNTVNVCHLDRADEPLANRICQPGDSGGPVYQYYGTQISAYGIISATNITGNVCWFSDIVQAISILGGNVQVY